MRHRSVGLALAICALSSAPVMAQESPQAHEAVAVLKSVGAPSVHSAGLLKRGDVIVGLPVTHGLTGVLRQAAQKSGFANRPSIPAGAVVYGIPVSEHLRQSITWCAPTDVSHPDKPAWDAVCFPQADDGIYRWISPLQPLFPTSFLFSTRSPTASVVDVERKPVDLPVMQLVFKFAKWGANDAIVVVSVDAPGADGFIDNRSLRRLPDGSARLNAFGGEFKLTPVGTDRNAAVLEVITPPSDAPKPEFGPTR